MLFLALKFLYIITLAYIYGGATLLMLRKLFRFEYQPLNFTVTAFAGLGVLSGILSYLSLFINIGLAVNLLLLAGALVTTYAYRHELGCELTRYTCQLKQYRWYCFALFAAAAAFAVYFSTLQTITEDEGTYHAQFIRWAQTYPAVPGLSNAELRLGFNSHWHLLTALFNWDYLTGLTSNHINGALYILMMLHCLSAFRDSNPATRFFKLCMMPLATLPNIMIYHMIAPSSDLVSIYYTFTVFILVLEKLKERKLFVFDEKAVCMLLLSAQLLTVKLSAVVIVFVPVAICIAGLKNRQFRYCKVFIIINLLFIVPWLIRNVIFTGYPVYPLNYFDVFNFDWEVPKSYIAEALESIRECAFRLYSNNAIDTKGMPLTEKYYTWFTKNIRIYDRLFITTSVVLWFVALIKARRQTLLVHCWLMAGILFWLLQAPDPRFGYIYLFCSLVFSLYLLADKTIIKFNKYIAAGMLAGLLLFQAGSFALHNYMLGIHTAREGRITKAEEVNKLLIPTPYPPTPMRTEMRDGQLIYTEWLSWAKAFPSITDPDVHLRGATFRNGFYHLQSDTRKSKNQ